MTFRDCYMTLFTDVQKSGFHLSAKPTEAIGREYIPIILSLQWLVFEETSKISSEISAEFLFFLVSTKIKVHWDCGTIFRGLKSYIISFLYLFASFVMTVFCSWGRTRAKSGIDGNIYGAALKRFHWFRRLDRSVVITDRSCFPWRWEHRSHQVRWQTCWKILQ